MTNKIKQITLIFALLFITLAPITAKSFDSYKGLVMAGYQGWFNTPMDGANKNWFHYQKGNTFAPGNCTIDMWPDMREYEVKYPTDFRFADGSTAYVFSSFDESTVDLHFRWMKEYGIDGVFLQRFVVQLKKEKDRNHMQQVLHSVMKAARKYNRAVAVMYDLSGMDANDSALMLEDWSNIVREYKIADRKSYPNYLHHNGKPLVAVWGVGFNDNRKYGFEEVQKIVSTLKKNGNQVYSLMLGVPTHWRSLRDDALKDTRLHSLISQADIVHPWFVGRYDQAKYNEFQPLIAQDIEWCQRQGVDYAPTVFPGFSWYNMKKGAPLNQIPRNGGDFFWTQIAGAIELGTEMLYVAMFDEIDEATAIMKCTNEVPMGKSKFVPIEPHITSDHYLWLTGQAARTLRKEIPFNKQQPLREIIINK